MFQNLIEMRNSMPSALANAARQSLMGTSGRRISMALEELLFAYNNVVDIVGSDTTTRVAAAHEQGSPQAVADTWALGIAGEVALILKDRRKTRNWLAEQMGANHPYVCLLLRDPPNMHLLTLAKLKVALDVPAAVGLNLVGQKSRSVK